MMVQKGRALQVVLQPATFCPSIASTALTRARAHAARLNSQLRLSRSLMRLDPSQELAAFTTLSVAAHALIW